jgi:hypothetical protein
MTEDAVVGFFTGGIVRGATGRVNPAPKIQQERAFAATAEQDAASLDRLMKGVGETNLAKRSPEKMSELLASLGGDRNVYVPADAVREYFQKLEPEEAAKQAAALGIDKQLTEAIATGGDVVIPLNQYVSHAPEDMAKAWREDIRLRSSGMSIKEAKAYAGADKEKAKQLGERVAGKLEQTTRENQAREAVVAQVEKQLQDAGESPEAARQIAQLYGERYATRAARLGEGDATIGLRQVRRRDALRPAGDHQARAGRRPRPADPGAQGQAGQERGRGLGPDHPAVHRPQRRHHRRRRRADCRAASTAGISARPFSARCCAMPRNPRAAAFPAWPKASAIAPATAG